MKTLRLPETATLFRDQAYSPETFKSLFSLVNSHPTSPSLTLTAKELDHQLFLFILENRPYAAGRLSGDRFEPLSLQRYFREISRAKNLSLTLHSVSPVFFKCLLVIVQKIPTSGGTTDLVNVEAMLHRVKVSKKEAIITVKQTDGLSFFYFSQGRLHDAYLAHSTGLSTDSSIEDQFLEYIYTASSEGPILVQSYEDVMVSPAEDHELQWEQFPDGIVEYFLKPRPELLFMSDGTIFNKPIHKNTFTIGRGPDCDAMLSDIKSSRKHAVIHEKDGRFFLEDCKSRNGTQLNGESVSQSELTNGDEIRIGNTRIIYSEPDRSQSHQSLSNEMQMETTQMNLADISAPKPPPQPGVQKLTLELLNGPKKGLVITLNERFTIGRNKSDLNLNDHKVSRKHGEIISRGGSYFFVDHKSTNGSFINDVQVHDQLIKPGDVIRVGDTLLKVAGSDVSK